MFRDGPGLGLGLGRLAGGPVSQPSMFIILWDVKEPTHLSLRVGHVVPGVVVCLLLCIMVGRVKKGPQ